MTQVIHIKDAPKGWRQNPRYLYIGRPSYLGNPFVVGRDGNREEVIEKYRAHFQRLQREDPDTFYPYMVALEQVKYLVCFCAPLACHGQVIVEYLNEDQKD